MAEDGRCDGEGIGRRGVARGGRDVERAPWEEDGVRAMGVSGGGRGEMER